MDCDERYFSLVTCARTYFLFSRREFSCCDMWDTMVRVAPPGQTFGPSEVTLSHTLNMSHNTAFVCVNDRTLVAIGGQLPDGVPSQQQIRWNPGIMRRQADPTALPLKWSFPSIVASGIKAKSRCIDARFRSGCDFDGKISATQFRGKLLVFTRANLLAAPREPHDLLAAAGVEKSTGMPQTDAGARHVQVAEASPLPARVGWYEARPFQRIRIDGYQHERTSNIYLWTVQQIGRHGLLALFPAVIRGQGGVWCSTSSDAVRWARPLLVMPADVVHGVRTRVHPVEVVNDGLHSGRRQPWPWLEHDAARNGSSTQPAIQGKHGAVLLQHGVYLHLAGKTPGCKGVERPRLFVYPYVQTGGGMASRCAAIRDALQRSSIRDSVRSYST